MRHTDKSYDIFFYLKKNLYLLVLSYIKLIYFVTTFHVKEILPWLNTSIVSDTQ